MAIPLAAGLIALAAAPGGMEVLKMIWPSLDPNMRLAIMQQQFAEKEGKAKRKAATQFRHEERAEKLAQTERNEAVGAAGAAIQREGAKSNMDMQLLDEVLSGGGTGLAIPGSTHLLGLRQ